MAFAITNMTKRTPSGGVNTDTINISRSSVGLVAVIIIYNGEAEYNDKYTPMVPTDFVQAGPSSGKTAVYTKLLTVSDADRTITITGGWSWGFIYFTIPKNYCLKKTLTVNPVDHNEDTIEYDSENDNAVIMYCGSDRPSKDYIKVENDTSDRMDLYIGEFAPSTSFPAINSNNNTSSLLYLIFQKGNYYNQSYKYDFHGLSFHGLIDVIDARDSYDIKDGAPFPTDILISDKFIYVFSYALTRLVTIYHKNKDGTFGEQYKITKWDNGYMPEINSGAYSTAIAIFTEDGIDKFVGWSTTANYIYVWDIIDGSITNNQRYKISSSFSFRSKGSWDGGNYIYFADYSSSSLFRWDIRQKNIAPSFIIVLNKFSNYMYSAYYSGSGLLVDTDKNIVYASISAHSTQGILLCWNLKTGAFLDKISRFSFVGSPFIRNDTGAIFLNPINRNIAYCVSSSDRGIHQLSLSPSAKRCYAYTSCVQSYVAKSSGLYSLQCYGATGGDVFNHYNSNYYGIGGYGGYSYGEIQLKQGDVLYIYVGEQGSDDGSIIPWNGGGKAAWTISSAGGGATDIRTIESISWKDNLDARIIVAGGGGGASIYKSPAGTGGGLSGGDSSDVAKGGTQVSGGTGYKNGVFGIGADGEQNGGGGGGGGWYGGGCGGVGYGYSYYSPGGGGSGYIGGVMNGSMKNGVNSYNGKVIIDKVKIKMSPFYAILSDDEKYYIPTKEFYDLKFNKFIPVTMDFLQNPGENFRSYIYDITDLNKRINYANGTNFLPFEKLNIKNAKIIKISIDALMNELGIDEEVFYQYNNVKKIDLNKSMIEYKYNTSASNINNSVIKIGPFSQHDNYSNNFIRLNTQSIKVLFEYRGKYYGTNLKETTLDNILVDGVDGHEINSYNVTFPVFNIYIAFKHKVNDIDNLSKILCHSREFQDMEMVRDYSLLHDMQKDNIYIKFNKDFNNILVKKLDNSYADEIDSMDKF